MYVLTTEQVGLLALSVSGVELCYHGWILETDQWSNQRQHGLIAKWSHWLFWLKLVDSTVFIAIL